MNITLVYQRINEINQARQLRKTTALNLHMGSQFIEYPKRTLEELQSIISVYDSIIQEGGEPGVSEVAIKKSEIEAMIYNNQYCAMGTPEWTYMENWKAQASSFVWPTPEELVLFNQEEEEITDLLNTATPY